jgi:putative DNA primase/helicase
MLKHNIQIGHSIGFSFTPLDGKRPILKEWQSRPRESLREAIEYANQGNVGLRCGAVSAPPGKYLVVIDEDGDVHLDLPPTVTVQTGRGRHYYCYADQPIGNSSGKLADHVDVRGEGGQVVYPGSIHPDRGTLYDWMTGMSPAEISIATLPDEIVKRALACKPPPAQPAPLPTPKPNGSSLRYALAGLEYECDNVRNAAEGTRNDQLNTSAFKLGTLIAAGHLDRTDAEQGLLAAATQAGLPRGEAAATIRSGLAAGLEKPRAVPGRRGADPTPAAKAAQNRPIPMTDAGNATRLAAHHGAGLRFCHPMGRWAVWTGKNWGWDDSGAILRHVNQTIETIWDEVNAVDVSTADGEAVRDKLTAWLYASQSRGHIDAMAHLTKPLLPVLPDELDKDGYLFNCANGTINLRTGQLQPHDPKDHITKLSPVEYYPDAECPLWLRFLDTIMEGNPDLIAFLQQLTGYCLSADITEQIFVIFYGSGANGKSTYVDTITGIMGDYAAPAPPDMLIDTGGQHHPTEIADLMGKRMAYTSETDEDVKLKTSLVKKITGETFLKARFMRQDHFTFNRTHKLIMQTNHKPTIRDANNAIWRRIRLVPFTVAIPDEQQDKQLLSKLKPEWPGILAWAVRGFADWQAAGRLISPAAVLAATEDYREEQNPLGEFLEERCEVFPSYYVPTKMLWEEYEKWCENNHEKYPIGRRNFSNRITAIAGIKSGRTYMENERARIFVGIGLRNNLFYQEFNEGLEDEKC